MSPVIGYVEYCGGYEEKAGGISRVPWGLSEVPCIECFSTVTNNLPPRVIL